MLICLFFKWFETFLEGGLPVPFHGQGQYSHQVGMSLTPGLTPNNSGISCLKAKSLYYLNTPPPPSHLPPPKKKPSCSVDTSRSAWSVCVYQYVLSVTCFYICLHIHWLKFLYSNHGLFFTSMLVLLKKLA